MRTGSHGGRVCRQGPLRTLTKGATFVAGKTWRPALAAPPLLAPGFLVEAAPESVEVGVETTGVGPDDRRRVRG